MSILNSRNKHNSTRNRHDPEEKWDGVLQAEREKPSSPSFTTEKELRNLPKIRRQTEGWRKLIGIQFVEILVLHRELAEICECQRTAFRDKIGKLNNSEGVPRPRRVLPFDTSLAPSSAEKGFPAVHFVVLTVRPHSSSLDPRSVAFVRRPLLLR